MTLLDVRDLEVVFRTRSGDVRAVDGVSLRVDVGRALGLVGESGSGKTVTALSVLGLVSPPGHVVGGRILFAGRDLLALDETAMRAVRGNDIGMVFQEPATSLNPVATVGRQIAEAVRLHQPLARRAARERAVELLELVEIPEAARRADAYPHQMSGGMRQRVVIAMALACHPRLLIADEPTTALDVTIQAQILDLLADLQRRLGMALLLVTHDLGIVAERADEIAVMYAGRIVETGPVDEVFRSPLHPYTVGLLRCMPGFGGTRPARLETIPGTPPDPIRRPTGCRFRDRCPIAAAACSESAPVLAEHRPGHHVACLRAGERSPA